MWVADLWGWEGRWIHSVHDDMQTIGSILNWSHVSGVTLQQTYESLTWLLTISGRSSHEVARGCRTIDPTGLEQKTGGFTRWLLLGADFKKSVLKWLKPEMDLSAKYRLRREKLWLWPSQKVDVFTNNALKNLTEGSEARSYSAGVQLTFYFCARKKNCRVPTFKRRRVTANPKQTMSSDKEAEPGSEKRTSPGRAVRGKLVNMVLYCTHDICFPSFIFSFIFFFSLLVWATKTGSYMFYTLFQKKFWV